MGITFLTFSGLLAPFQQLVGWLATAPLRGTARGRPAGAAHAGPPYCGGNRSRPVWAGATRAALPPRRPLRVLRVVDACHAPASAGRMVISGRMADVCAELERLA
ncbi:MAG: hypothetical protein JWQ33_1756, partial [Ramlibacter sp.]|nr:hypothetical protein [Ramlibacter sp.]